MYSSLYRDLILEVDDLMTEEDLEMELLEQELREKERDLDMEEDNLPVHGPFPAYVEDHSDELPF